MSIARNKMTNAKYLCLENAFTPRLAAKGLSEDAISRRNEINIFAAGYFENLNAFIKVLRQPKPEIAAILNSLSDLFRFSFQKDIQIYDQFINRTGLFENCCFFETSQEVKAFVVGKSRTTVIYAPIKCLVFTVPPNYPETDSMIPKKYEEGCRYCEKIEDLRRKRAYFPCIKMDDLAVDARVFKKPRGKCSFAEDKEIDYSNLAWFMDFEKYFKDPFEITSEKIVSSPVFFWKPVFGENTRVRDLLFERSGRIEDIRTQVIGRLGFENPFSQMFTGVLNEKTIVNAWECLKNEEFLSKLGFLPKILRATKAANASPDIEKIVDTCKNLKLLKTECNHIARYKTLKRCAHEKYSKKVVDAGRKYRLLIRSLGLPDGLSGRSYYENYKTLIDGILSYMKQ